MIRVSHQGSYMPSRTIVRHMEVVVKRVPAGPEPYHRVQGWRCENQTYKGQFMADGVRCPGELWQHWGKICGRIANVPEAVLAGPHGACFSTDHEHNGWYRIHFADMPKTIDGAILAIEHAIRESVQ